jgi:hypothetical protein
MLIAKYENSVDEQQRRLDAELAYLAITWDNGEAVAVMCVSAAQQRRAALLCYLGPPGPQLFSSLFPARFPPPPRIT